MMNKKLIHCLLLTIIWSITTYSQTYQDHFGTGNNVGVNATSSPTLQENEGSDLLNGTEFFLDEVGASRFLSQATLGANYEDIQHLTQIGVGAWIEEQVNMPYIPLIDYTTEINDSCYNRLIASGIASNSQHLYRSNKYPGFAFYQKAFTENDKLRQKVAFSLSQILVLSIGGVQYNYAFGCSDYYDILLNNAFGNFRDILYDASIHPLMGVYLSHFHNKKSNGITEPDENFAREVMQLFSIGLYELNTDGSYKLNANGEKIPTYDNDDIENLARVFTGLDASAVDTLKRPDLVNATLDFATVNGDNLWDFEYDYTQPMKVYQNQHDTGQKIFLNDTIPAGQIGINDINQAIDILFNHPNVGPFIARRLIQQMVKSNPSPQYINRVALAFNNNGNGLRGDMLAVVKAILLDPEARNCDLIDGDITTGRLIQPIERLIKLGIGFDIYTQYGTNEFWFWDYWNTHETHYRSYKYKLGQAFLLAPSVFNFFTPFYQESSVIDSAGLVSPEFQILDAVSTIHYINFTLEMPILPFYCSNRGTASGMSFYNADYTRLDLSSIENLIPMNFTNQVSDYEAMLDYLDLILCRGQLQSDTRNLILNTLVNYKIAKSNLTRKEIVEDAITLLLITPEFLILK